MGELSVAVEESDIFEATKCCFAFGWGLGIFARATSPEEGSDAKCGEGGRFLCGGSMEELPLEERS